MKNCAIIGAGQLGSRHLQGLLKTSEAKLNIYVVDPVLASLKTCQIRSKEILHSHQIFFVTDITHIPKSLDFVVISTSSDTRMEVLEKLYNHATVETLILEKVLFQSVEHYHRAHEIVQSHNTKCWVNHPRRMNKVYKELKKGLMSKGKVTFQVFGSEWGLACNSLHFIDLFEFITNSKLDSLSTDFLDNEVKNSKRDGFIEFSGTLIGNISGNNSFSITSENSDKQIAPSICIMSKDFRVFIQELEPSKIYLFKRSNNFILEEKSLEISLQSNLTTELFSQLNNIGECDLPTFEEASLTHQIFISSLLNHWNKITRQEKIILPIT